MFFLLSDVWNYIAETASETLGYKTLVVLGFLLALLILATPGRKISDRIALALLAAYLTLVFASTVLFRAEIQPSANNIIPFSTWQQAFSTQNTQLTLQNIENIALFLPAGIALGWLCRDAEPLECLIAYIGVMLFSLSIEALQFHYSIGMSDIDDVINNCLGLIIGYVIIRFLYKPLRKIQ